MSSGFKTAEERGCKGCTYRQFPIFTTVLGRAQQAPIRNGALRNGQQPGSGVNSFIDKGEFQAMNTLNGCRALCYDKHQFYAKMMVNTCTDFELSSLNIVV